MTDPTFTILMPVIRTPELMLFAINSVLGQTRGDFELFIVCDGAPLETIRAAETVSAHDARVRVFPFPKGEGHGEAHRHTVLQQARGPYICGLADDDLWFPEHLDEMDALLSEFEFGNLLHANVMLDAPLFVGLSDFGDPKIRARMMSEPFNVFGPSHGGYRLETYNRLPIGWSPAPEGDYPDLAMWRKFLALPDLVAGTRFVLTSLHFASPHRRTWSVQERREETARYAALIATSQGRNMLRHWAFREVAREYTASHEYIFSLRNYMEILKENLANTEKTMEAELAAVRSSLSWRITAPLRSAARPIASWSLWRSKNH
jgi:glycosyltransferase involved in cell wall biosynthesis